MVRQKNRLSHIRSLISEVMAIRNEMIFHLDYCPAEATPIVLDNIDKADRELRRLNRERRTIEKQQANN